MVLQKITKAAIAGYAFEIHVEYLPSKSVERNPLVRSCFLVVCVFLLL